MYCHTKMQYTSNNYSALSFIDSFSNIPEDTEILTITHINIPNGRCMPKFPKSVKTVQLDCNIKVDGIRRIRADWTTADLKSFLKVVFGENRNIAIELGKNILHIDDYKGINDEIYHSMDNKIYAVFKNGVANLDDIDDLYA